MYLRIFALALVTLSAAAVAATGDNWQLPIETKQLANGLTVVVSEDHSSPTVGISMVYHVGMRLEPKGRTGFAHLFEHLMFQGTPNAPKGIATRVIQGGGGLDNGSTRADYTNYIETAPVSALEPILWLEADRMKTLDFSGKNLANQQEVVKEEIRVNVKNKPYGLFFWTDLSNLAFDRWENKHDGYGSFEDLNQANLKDVQTFHQSFYGPNNAVLAIVGDVKPTEIFALAEKYFGAIPARNKPALPEVNEGLNTAERRLSQTDPLARVPAIAVGWKMPERGSKDQAAAELLGQLLLGGDASRLYLGLIKGRELLLQLEGGVNWPLGYTWDYAGPTQFILFALYKPTTDIDKILAAVDEEISKIVKEGVGEAELKRTKTKLLSNYYSGLEKFMDRANELAKTQTLWGDAKILNQVPNWIAAVTSDDLKRVATTYLTKANRSVIDRKPASAQTGK